jgi:hypothetical protein
MRSLPKLLCAALFALSVAFTATAGAALKVTWMKGSPSPV